MINILNKPKRLLFIISFLVMVTFLGSCSASKKAKKKCRECPEFSMDKTHDVNTFRTTIS